MVITVTTSGPFFDGRAEAAIARACDDIQDQAAAQASADLHLWMNHFFRHPTPYYETQVTTQNVGESTVVHDRGIIYGPWLAGSSGRNQTSRFRGYAHWRLAVQGAEQRVPQLAATVLARYEAAFNG